MNIISISYRRSQARDMCHIFTQWTWTHEPRWRTDTDRQTDRQTNGRRWRNIPSVI